MKTIRTLTMMFALIVIANMAMATGNLRVDILPLTADRAVVAISNNAESKFQISIENSSGEMIYYKETEGNAAEYRKIYDFSKLEKGDYRLTVSIDGAVSERAFSIESKNINVGKMKNVVEPFFSFKDDILRVAYLNYPGENMNLLIYEGSNLIYNKALENTFSVNEGLNLSKLKNGNYQVVLATGNDVFDYTVEVK
ncbi:hypothetical protein [Gaoshiqia sp. Z1-71]|uniref:hypothetical protein n=1 Tax=Gaoshiqia hydrogeniformans TaxID=3290090 RepID=UPI003BF7AADC